MTQELIQSMQAAQANVVAGELLTRSKELMKRRHDKKLNPITFNNLDKTDEVLIENVYQKKKGGKFHDKWFGPYKIAKLNRNTVKIYRNKSIQRVKRSKLKPLKRLTPINSADQQATRSHRLSTEIETSTIEYLQASRYTTNWRRRNCICDDITS